MDIKDKLAFYSAGKKSGQPAGRMEDQISTPLKALKEILNAEIIQPNAPYLKINRTYSIPSAFELNREIPLKLLSKNQVAKNIPLEQCLFFDLETTGLAGGAGTYPFLLGFGFFKNNALQVEQFFLPDYGREYSLFKTLQEFFKDFSYLISYNGKSYDYPLLKNRFVLNRLKPDWEHWQHIDLLHIARRIWSDSFPSRDLGTIEREVLNRERSGDIPGYQIPQAYFHFIRSGAIHDITRIIEHNALDIVSLGELLLYMGRIEAQPSLVTDKPALLRLAALAEEMDDFDYFSRVAEHYFIEALNLSPVILHLRSRFFKRRRNWQMALDDWQKLIASGSYTFYALEEIAKYFEHIKKDHKQALQYTEKALQYFRTLSELHPYSVKQEIGLDFRKRRNRLLQKLA